MKLKNVLCNTEKNSENLKNSIEKNQKWWINKIKLNEAKAHWAPSLPIDGWLIASYPSRGESRLKINTLAPPAIISAEECKPKVLEKKSIENPKRKQIKNNNMGLILNGNKAIASG